MTGTITELTTFAETDYQQVLPDKTLVVCAGSVTCRNVADMKSGFLVFKKIFGNTGSEPWVPELQNDLNETNKSQAIKPFHELSIAKSGSLSGAVATVPALPTTEISENGQTRTVQSRPPIDNENKQYVDAVKGAVQSALGQNRPLFLQPLGTGVYAWTPEQAAALFAQAIVEVDTERKLQLIVPSFQATQATAPSSIFFQKLQSLLGNQYNYSTTTSARPTDPASPNTPHPVSPPIGPDAPSPASDLRVTELTSVIKTYFTNTTLSNLCIEPSPDSASPDAAETTAALEDNQLPSGSFNIRPNGKNDLTGSFKLTVKDRQVKASSQPNDEAGLFNAIVLVAQSTTGEIKIKNVAQINSADEAKAFLQKFVDQNKNNNGLNTKFTEGRTVTVNGHAFTCKLEGGALKVNPANSPTHKLNA